MTAGRQTDRQTDGHICNHQIETQLYNLRIQKHKRCGQTGRQTRQTRQTDKPTDRQTDRQDRQICALERTNIVSIIETQFHKMIICGMQTDGQTDRQTDRQTRHTGRQTGRPAISRLSLEIENTCIKLSIGRHSQQKIEDGLALPKKRRGNHSPVDVIQSAPLTNVKQIAVGRIYLKTEAKCRHASSTSASLRE